MIVSMPSRDTDDFEAFVRLPENRDRMFELIGGEIVEVVSNPLSSNIAARFLIEFGGFVYEHNLGHVTGADGGYVVLGEYYIPDCAFISYAKLKTLQYNEGYIPVAPDLAVEVISPGNTEDEIATKVGAYLAAGTMVILVNPRLQLVTVFIPGQLPKRLTVKDEIDGGDVLPGFRLPVQRLFPQQPEEEKTDSEENG